MNNDVKSPDDYASKVPEDRRVYFNQLRETISQSIPEGFSEQLSGGMIGWVVPHSIYPEGYHCKPADPLPFINIANQKNFIGFYHMGMYADKKLSQWFVNEYPKHCKLKIDMGKSCVRFKKPEQIPFELLAQLMQKMTVEQWIATYEGQIKR